MSYSNAIVVGSRVGGLMTACVLSDHFDHVALIDRDSIPEAPGIRKGAPQGNHFHAILPGGLGIMNGLFPGFDRDLEDKGSLVPESATTTPSTGKACPLPRVRRVHWLS
jgi:glycine/D-amino acid oxidase-like deaminating enzyme